jgi:hypothetical protein
MAPILVAPIEREPLLLYIMATTQAVSAALVAEREETRHALKVQCPVYYAVLIARRKLRHYFESHPMTLVLSFPLGEVIQNFATGRIAKWALELMGEGITYTPRTAIKSQALADFVAEWTEVQTPPVAIDHEYWMYFDGSLMKKGADVGLIFVFPLGVRLRYMVRLLFPASNNVAKYEALINGLRIAIELGVRWLDVRGDSQLVIGQVMK